MAALPSALNERFLYSSPLPATFATELETEVLDLCLVYIFGDKSINEGRLGMLTPIVYVFLEAAGDSLNPTMPG